MATLADIKAEILAESWQGILYEQITRQEGATTRHSFSFFPKDTPIDTGKHDSDLSWLLRQRVLVDDEAGPAEAAYYEGPFIAPLYNAFLRWLAANIAAPKYVHSWTFLSESSVRFVEMDVSSGYAVDRRAIGQLVNGEIQVTYE